MKTILTTWERSLFLVLIIPALAFGQATLKGTVTDADKNEAMISVSVMITGTSLGASTDIEGQYRIVGIPERVCTVKVSYIGYEPQELTVDFTKTKDATLNIQIRPTVIQGEEVVVTGQMRGQNAAINQQVKSDRSINVVSEEKIKELPDANAAEAIGRLPGVAIQRNNGEASKVVLRGLSSQFSNITIDGVSIPGTDQNRKEVDLSMISQGALSGVELYKTLMPDQDADAIAGAVNLVTKKAPAEREIRLELKGGYNHLMKSQDQYEVAGSYGSRFFDNLLGVQIRGNVERKIRSKERLSYGYDEFYDYSKYFIPGFENDYRNNEVTTEFTDEIRTRKGGQVIFDVNTPDEGTIKLSGIYNATGRNVYLSDADYSLRDNLMNHYRYTEQELATVNIALQGKNHLEDFDIDWGVTYAHSKTSTPYDFMMQFYDRNAVQMPSSYTRFSPQEIITAARPNYQVAFCTTSAYYKRENLDKERTAHVNIGKKYTISDLLSGEVKLGAKIKERERWMNNEEYDSNDYLNTAIYTNKDGSLKQYKGTRFEDFFSLSSNMEQFIYFVDFPIKTRTLLGKYTLSPLVNSDVTRLWHDLNINGANGSTTQYGGNAITHLDDYSLIERVSSGFIMNTLNIGQMITLIAGIRVEQDHNDYKSKILYGGISNFGFQQNVLPDAQGRGIEDSTTIYNETMWLPHAHLTVRPLDYLTVRLEAYKAIARPDYNLRLPRFYKRGSKTNPLIVCGNPGLKNMQAWNYEANVQVHNDWLGLVSLSGFYKVIDNYFHTIEAFNPTGGVVDSLSGYPFSLWTNAIGIQWQNNPIFKELMDTKSSLNNRISLTVPYSSPDPSYAWGFEFEHQMNFSSLPIGFLKNITLSYNVSITRSETNIYDITRGDTVRYVSAYPTPPRPPVFDKLPIIYGYKVIKRSSEDQPNFYGNLSVGYDIGGFSTRVSVHHTDEYVERYPGDYLDAVDYTDSYTKWDLTVKQKFSEIVSIYANFNNLTNVVNTRSHRMSIYDWNRLRSEESYGMTADFGVIINL